MATFKPIAYTMLLLVGAVLLMPGCVVEPREGFYDRHQHRWWHEHEWRDCADRDEHCHN